MSKFWLSKSFYAGLAYGLALWILPTQLLGYGEPWDGNFFWIYLTLLLVGGAGSAYLLGGSPKMAYWSIYFGQFLYGFFMIFMTRDGALFPVGAVMLLVCTLPALMGAVFVHFYRKKKS